MDRRSRTLLTRRRTRTRTGTRTRPSFRAIWSRTRRTQAPDRAQQRARRRTLTLSRSSSAVKRSATSRIRNGHGTFANITAVTAATTDDPITAAERYYNKTGIRVSLADPKAKLPGCNPPVPRLASLAASALTVTSTARRRAAQTMSDTSRSRCRELPLIRRRRSTVSDSTRAAALKPGSRSRLFNTTQRR